MRIFLAGCVCLLSGCGLVSQPLPNADAPNTVPTTTGPVYSEAQKQLSVWGVLWFPPGATAAYIDPFLFANGTAWDAPADPKDFADVQMFQKRYLNTGAKYKVILGNAPISEVTVQNSGATLQTPVLGATQRGLSLVTNDQLFTEQSKKTTSLSPTQEQMHAFRVACESSLQGTGGAVVHQLVARDLFHDGKLILIGVGSRRAGDGENAGIIMLGKPHGNEYVTMFSKQFTSDETLPANSNFTDFRIPFIVGDADIDHDGVDEVVALSEDKHGMTYHVIGFTALSWRDRFTFTRQE